MALSEETEAKFTPVEVWGDCQARTGESPFWDQAQNRILWVDIRGNKIFESDWATRAARILSTADLPAFVASGRDGALLIAARQGVVGPDGLLASRGIPSRPPDMTDDFRFNDGTIDPNGRLVIGTMLLTPSTEMFKGALYSFDLESGWRLLLDGLGIINGLAFSPNGDAIYLSDSHPMRREISRYDYDANTATLSNGRLLVSFEERGWPGTPDGAAIDIHGRYWLAAHGAGAILRLTADGALEEEYPMPFPRVSKPAFVGPALDHIAVTSFAEDAIPSAGRLITFQAGTKGFPLGSLCF